MKVKVIEQFYDRENDLKLRKKGSIIEVKKARGESLIESGYVEEFTEEVKEEVEETAEETKETEKKTKSEK